MYLETTTKNGNKVMVHTILKALDVDIEEVMSISKEINIKIKSAQCIIDMEEANKLVAHIHKAKQQLYFNPEEWCNDTAIDSFQNLVTFIDTTLNIIDTQIVNNSHVLSNSNNVYKELQCLDTDNKDLIEIKIYLLSKFDFSLEHLKDKLIFMKSEALEQLDSIDDSLSIWNDEKLSKKEINFNFTAKKIVRLYEEQMVKIDNFSNVNNFFSQLLFSIQELKNTDEKFKTTDREKLKQVLEDGYLGAYSDLLYSEWSKETDKINKFYIVCIKAYFVGKISQDMLLGIFTILQSIKQNLEEFYIVIRSGIVVKYKENPKSELLQHISVKDRVFKIYKNSQPKFIELLKKETSQVAYRFLNNLLSELLDFKFEEKSDGYEEIYEKMMQLHSKNLEIYLNDIEMYGKELEKRDLEILKLIFQMQTDLEKKGEM